jgi:hypothetical protein
MDENERKNMIMKNLRKEIKHSELGKHVIGFSTVTSFLLISNLRSSW